MKLINLEYIKSLNPCEDRLEEALKHYPNWEGSLKQMLNLKKLSHNDKVWVFVRSIDPKFLPLVAADFAGEVLYIYEKQYPDDKRPRLDIKAAISGDKAKTSVDAITQSEYASRVASTTATNDTAHDAYAVYYAFMAAAHAAYAVAQAASATTYVAAHSASSAAIYATTYAYAASNASHAATTKTKKKQIEIMKRYI